jgi:hypothetical protein
MWGEDGFSFGDILDTLNPLQHLPVVSTLYRALTGDAIAPAPRVFGAALFGGPIGAAVGAANAALKSLSGKDAGEHVLAFLPLPTRVDGETVMLAFHDAAKSLPTMAPTARKDSVLDGAQKARLVRAMDQARLVPAHDAYVRTSKLLTVSQKQNRFGIRF